MMGREIQDAASVAAWHLAVARQANGGDQEEGLTAAAAE
jgi:hypothetical protein